MISRQYLAFLDRAVLGKESYFSHSVRPSRSFSRSGSSDGNYDGVASNIEQANQSGGAKAQANPAQGLSISWLPYTFKHSFLAVLSSAALCLCLVTFLLWWRSSTNYGIGPDDGTSVLLFGWRYTPTLIAVIYVQMTTVLFEDVKRTEPYARLARPQGAEASTSVLKESGAWWNALYDGFAKKKNKSRSWAMICASILNIIGFLAISSLSSAYLFSEDLVVPKSISFLSLTPEPTSSLPIDADRTTHFRTIANLLQNVSTSPWITDEYTILPVWPADLKTAPITSLPTSSSQTWDVQTTMFKSDFQCAQMTLEGQTELTMKLHPAYAPLRAVSMMWSAPDGCKYGLSVWKRLFNIGGGSWSDISTFYYAESTLVSSQGAVFNTNHTAECSGKELLLVTEPWTTEDARYSVQLCDTRYYMANVTTSIGLTGDEPSISYNETEFEQNKIPIPNTLLNTTEFRNLTLDSNWPTYMISILWSRAAFLGGPSILLGALYDYNMTALVNDPNWVSPAAKAKQRYFGEVLQAALTQRGAAKQTKVQGKVHDVQARVVVQPLAAIALGTLFAFSFFFAVAVWWLSRLRRRPLNLKEDPASALGVATLLTHNARTIETFRGFKHLSGKGLHESLDGEWFYSDSQGLCRVNLDELTAYKKAQSGNGTPVFLRLPALLGLVTALLSVVVGIVVLYHFAETTGLYEQAFVYSVDISWLANGISSAAPFSMIPTIIATGIGLWWGAIDDNFRRLQPFIVMSKGSTPFSQGVGLTYQSSFWLWACIKAALNKHWLLSLLTLGSTLAPIFTISMSALFDRGPGIVSQPISLNRSIEIRDIPFVFPTYQAIYPGYSNDYAATVLADLYKNLSTNWMYTATIQLTLNGSEPAWSKDGWSFVPAMLDSIHKVDLPNNLDASDQSVDASQLNVSFTTPAIRGRIECTEYPSAVFANISNWLLPRDLSNHSYWNSSTIPQDDQGNYLEGGYQLGALASWLGREYPTFLYPLNSSQAALESTGDCPGCTTIFINPSEIVCCGNTTSDSRDQSVAVGYWSPNTDLKSWTVRQWNQNFTAKWFHGNAVPGISSNVRHAADWDHVDLGLLFPTLPSMSLLNCRPLVESAEADITVNAANGAIQAFSIKSEPKELIDAFSDNFLPHNKTHFDPREGYVHYNVTVSYGRLFMSSMLTAADTLNIGGAQHVAGYTIEDLNDNTYNIRDEINGLNMDFMSYAMYSMANKDAKALLDMDTFTTLAQKTFTTFFQHFVSNDVSLETGGWGYQKINASLPSTLGPIIELENGFLPGTTASKYQDVMHPISHTNRTVSATMTQRVELLQMNGIAVWLSLAILVWLIGTTAVVAVLQKRYFGSLVRNVECLGDVLVLVAGSANLLQLVRDIQAGRLVKGDYEDLRTRLGWFVDSEGGLRWGVEMEESLARGPGVQWVRAPGFGKEDGGSWTSKIEDEEFL